MCTQHGRPAVSYPQGVREEDLQTGKREGFPGGMTARPTQVVWWEYTTLPPS